jgi:hypothetical protein
MSDVPGGETHNGEDEGLEDGSDEDDGNERVKFSESLSRSLRDLGRIDPSVWQSVRSLQDVQAQAGMGLSQIVAKAGAFSSLEAVRRANRLAGMEIPALRAMEVAARFSTGPSLVSGTLAAQLADARLTDFTSITSAAFKTEHQSTFLQLAQVSKFVEQQSASLAAIRPLLEISRSVTFATQAWESVVQHARPDLEVSLGHVRMATRGTAGAVEAGVLLTESDEGAWRRCVPRRVLRLDRRSQM